jgi:predicted permease
MLDRLSRELRYALRTFRLNPGYFAVTVLTLAVGIGANTAIFSVVKGVLLDTLPYEDPDRVVGIWQYTLSSGQRARMTPGNFADVRAMSDVFESAAAFGFTSATLIGADSPELIRGGRVSASYFDVLGVQPLVGRPFRADEEDPGGAPVTIISEELWARRFASDPGIVGTTLNLDGTPFEVVGVLPRGIYPTYATVNGETPFTPDNHDFLVPLRLDEDSSSNRRSHVLGAIGKLAAGVGIERANEAIGALAASLAEQHPEVAGEGFRVDLLKDEITGGAHAALLVLMGTVAVVLLIAATNVASLMLARSDARRSEIAVRAALGAGRWALIRQSLVEGLALAGTGAAAGVALAYFGVDRIKALVPFQIPRMNEVGIDVAVLAFTVSVALLVGAALGVAPAIAATRPGMLDRLRQGARGLTADGKQRRAQGFMVAAQACMAVMLVVGAGLLVRTFLQITRIDPGFSRAGVLAVPVSLPQTRYPGTGEALAFFQRLRETLTASPAIASVAFGYDHPLGKSWGDSFRIEGRPEPPPEASMGASFRPVTPGYFETAGIPIMKGRIFESTDDAAHPDVVVINEAFAAQYFAGEEPIGQRMRIPSMERMFGDGTTPRWFEIVGIIGNVRFNGPTEAIEPAMYVSIPQVPMSDVVMLVAPARPGVDLLGAVRSAVWRLDPELPVDNALTLDVMRSEAIARERFNMLLVGFFATLALGLAGLGIYGLISRLVHMQTKEIGIRVALGARRGQILGLVLGGALVPVVIGGLLGIAGAAGLSRLLGSLLYGVAALDPATFLLTPLLLVATALLASYLPARRATRIDPVTALRND